MIDARMALSSASEPGPLPSDAQLCSTPHTPSSLFVTFKVAQLVNAFRKRVKTRVLSRANSIKASIKIQDDFCQDFERRASKEIDSYLGRKTAHANGKRIYPAGQVKKRLSSQTLVADQIAEESWRTSFTRFVMPPWISLTKS